jgi:hypothetical protein
VKRKGEERRGKGTNAAEQIMKALATQLDSVIPRSSAMVGRAVEMAVGE